MLSNFEQAPAAGEYQLTAMMGEIGFIKEFYSPCLQSNLMHAI